METHYPTQEQQFRTWMETHADHLFQFARARVRDEDLAKDLVQETFLAAWKGMADYRGEASVKNWLFVLLKNKITDHYRKAHSRYVAGSVDRAVEDRHFFDEEDHWRERCYPQSWTVDFSSPVEAKEFQQVFRSCSEKMKEAQHSVFVMKYVDGLDSGEICRALGISPANYWVLIHRAKVQLRACLEKNWL